MRRPELSGLEGQTGVVTGASRGIGAACALALAQEGMDLCLFARSTTTLDELATQCRREGVRALGVECDVTNAASVEAAVSRAVQEFGSIDLLVSNAGVATYKCLFDLSEKEWDEMQEVNLKGTFLMFKAILPRMAANRRGTVITVSSIRGFDTLPTTPGYSASKFGIMGLNSAVEKDVRAYGIRMGVICPGGVRTWLRGSAPEEKDPNWLDPVDVARAVVFMAKAPEHVAITQLHIIANEAVERGNAQSEETR